MEPEEVAKVEAILLNAREQKLDKDHVLRIVKQFCELIDSEEFLPEWVGIGLLKKALEKEGFNGDTFPNTKAGFHSLRDKLSAM